MTISRADDESLSVQINSWPEDPDAPREWSETSPERKGKTFHEFSQLRPGARYELRINGRVRAFLRADKTGHAEFTYKEGYTVPVKFQLAPVSARLRIGAATVWWQRHWLVP
jgi:hypothetical protein